MNNTFSDPENIDELLEQLKNQPTLGDVKDFITNIFPTWIVDMLPSFCDDYPILNSHWNKVCELAKVPRRGVVLVRHVSFDDDHKLILSVCEIISKSGFSVKLCEDFFPCPICRKAIPTLENYKKFQENKTQIEHPETWLTRCKNC